MENFTLTKGLKKLGCSYLGGVTHSAKMVYSYNKGTATYCLYLAPSTMANPNRTVCPNDKWCRNFCLNGAGRNKGDIISRGFEESNINKSRIKKTNFFFDEKETFMQILIHEITREKNKAEKNNMEFSVRLNGTSDISPEDFILHGKNILEIFPDVTFYDYTKIPQRIALMKKYPNYDITLSFNGYNKLASETFLKHGGKVAVVFLNNLPKKFLGYEVIDGNGYDMRYKDKPQTIIGLHYHKTANDYVNGEFITPKTKFVVLDDDSRCEW